MWAGLNLVTDDLHPTGVSSIYYPIELVHALAAVWLFSGLRSDEIMRLRVGCVRWQSKAASTSTSTERGRRESVCLLDVPVNKTGTAFTDPPPAMVNSPVSS
jgi:hypothetical protein